VVAAKRERADFPALDEVVQAQPDTMPLAEAEPADAGGQPLRPHAVASEREPALEPW
jgi:hypothetical protein